MESMNRLGGYERVKVLNAVGQKLGESMRENRPNVKVSFLVVVAQSLARQPNSNTL
jgi:hypothetical protein